MLIIVEYIKTHTVVLCQQQPSRMAKIFESLRTAKNFENVSW